MIITNKQQNATKRNLLVSDNIGCIVQVLCDFLFYILVCALPLHFLMEKQSTH